MVAAIAILEAMIEGASHEAYTLEHRYHFMLAARGRASR
jgi:hypothetical protein